VSPTTRGADPASARLPAIDLARLVAIVGMISAHLLPTWTTPPGSFVTAATTGFPSTLFAVLGGVGAAFAARRNLAAGRGRAAAGAQIGRGLVVAIVGVVLALVPSTIAIVLVPFGVSLMAVALLLPASTPALLAVASALAVVGPLLTAHLHTVGADGDPPPLSGALETILLTGVYPVITWIVYMIAGLLVGRAIIAARRAGATAGLGARLAVVGAGVAAAASAVGTWYVAAVAGPRAAAITGEPLETVVAALGESGAGWPISTGWDAILVGAPHTGSTIDILRTTGGALLVIGLLLAVVRPSAPRDPVLRVLAAAGGASLTIYTIHVLTVIPLAIADTGRDGDARSLLVWGLDLAIVVVIGAVLARTGRRGPFEALVHGAGRLGARIAG